MVAYISLCLGEWLREEMIYLDLQLLTSAALLHDIAKMKSINNGLDHAELGAEWLIDEGYPEVAEVVSNHVVLQTDLSGPIVAKEIVYYADKRVRHCEIVSVAERLQDLRIRYGVDSLAMGRLSVLGDLTRSVEIKLFTPLKHRPDDISENSIIKNLLTYAGQTNI
jgi:putative nucleotidyltransferase with HDIG domain